MFSRDPKDRFAFLVDIGSGSVGLALCHSNKEKKPHILWFHREHIPLRDIDAVSDSSKVIVTTLMNAMMMFEQEGRPALSTYQAGAKITTMQATIAAPWAYTTTRTITFEQDEPFEINHEMIADLAAAAGQQAIDEFNEQHSLETLGIIETSRCALDTYANGYRLTKANNQQATVINVTHATTLVREEIVTALTEMNNKLFNRVPLRITSYMLANYFATRLLLPHIYDVCLVDVTNEATEIGIIRDGSLQYSTHTPFGRASLAREISTATKIPLAETFHNFPDPESAKTKDIQAIYDAYIEKIHELFQQTGDRLTIPRNIYLETDRGLEAVFSPLIAQAGTQASKGRVHITTIRDKIEKSLTKESSADTALMVSASFFHTSETRSHFEYL